MGVETDPGPGGACADARLRISLDADGESSADDRRWLSSHLAGCAACRDYADDLAVLTRTMRFRPAAVDPAFTERAVRSAGRLGRGWWLRPALAWCGAVVGVQSVGPLFRADAEGSPAHIARHIGTYSLALAIGFVYAAWRPRRAFGLLPFVAAMAITTVIAAVLDVVNGIRSAWAETAHVAEVLGMVFLWMLAGSPGWERLTGWWRRAWGARRAAGPPG